MWYHSCRQEPFSEGPKHSEQSEKSLSYTWMYSGATVVYIWLLNGLIYWFFRSTNGFLLVVVLEIICQLITFSTQHKSQDILFGERSEAVNNMPYVQ